MKRIDKQISIELFWFFFFLFSFRIIEISYLIHNNNIMCDVVILTHNIKKKNIIFALNGLVIDLIVTEIIAIIDFTICMYSILLILDFKFHLSITKWEVKRIDSLCRYCKKKEETIVTSSFVYMTSATTTHQRLKKHKILCQRSIKLFNEQKNKVLIDLIVTDAIQFETNI